MTIARKKSQLHARWKPKSEGGVESSSQWGYEKNPTENSGWRSMRRRLVVHSNGEESLNEITRSSPQSVPKLIP
jgi:hypothetical protein